MTSDRHTFTAADLCAILTTQLNGDDIHVYGAAPNDAVLVGAAHTTTVLSTRGGQPRWFKVVVEEFYPDTDDPLWLDYDVLGTLARRAGLPVPPFRLGPTAPGAGTADCG